MQRAHFYKWLMFLTNTIQPDLTTSRYPERHTTDSAGVAAVKAAAETWLDTGYRVVEEALGRGWPLSVGRVDLSGGLLSAHGGELGANDAESSEGLAQHPSLRRLGSRSAIGSADSGHGRAPSALLKDLDVDYPLEGSARRDSDRVGIAGQRVATAPR